MNEILQVQHQTVHEACDSVIHCQMPAVELSCQMKGGNGTFQKTTQPKQPALL
jgi:hypothetical protein